MECKKWNAEECRNFFKKVTTIDANALEVYRHVMTNLKKEFEEPYCSFLENKIRIKNYRKYKEIRKKVKKNEWTKEYRGKLWKELNQNKEELINNCKKKKEFWQKFSSGKFQHREVLRYVAQMYMPECFDSTNFIPESVTPDTFKNLEDFNRLRPGTFKNLEDFVKSTSDDGQLIFDMFVDNIRHFILVEIDFKNQ